MASLVRISTRDGNARGLQVKTSYRSFSGNLLGHGGSVWRVCGLHVSSGTGLC